MTRSRTFSLLFGLALGALASLRPVPVRAGASEDAAIARAAVADAVDAQLGRMSVREKAAQMVMPWIEGDLEPGSAEWRRARRLVRVHRVGGFIVGKGSRSGTAAALAALQRESRVPLLVGADLEWGAGMRLLGASLLPVAMAVGATGDTVLAYEHARLTALEARASGVNMVLAPVLDVNIDRRNPIINTRAYGADPELVAALGVAAARGLRDGGVLAVGKHFPGHGDTDGDSHVMLPVLRATRTRLDAVDLVPFAAAVRARIDGIMVAHIALPAITGDRTPASLSRRVTTGILRDQLHHEGLIITDALNMAGVTRAGEGPAVALRAVQAGADILLQPPNAELAIDAIAEAVQRGELSRQRLDASVRRILRAKARVGLLATVAAPSPFTPEDARRSAALADTIATRSLTLLHDTASLLPLRPGMRVLSISYATASVPGGPSDALEHALRASGVSITRRSLPTRIAAAVADSLVRAWEGGDPPLVLLATYAAPIAGRRAIGLPFAVAQAMERIAGAAPTIHVVFGDPYIAADVPSAGTLLLAWSGIPAAQRAAARALSGSATITGRAPVSVAPSFPLGSGLTPAHH